MGFDDRAVQSEEHAAIDLSRVDAFAQALQRCIGQKGGNTAERRILERLAQEFGDQRSGAFSGLQGDIPGKPVGDDHIDLGRRDIAAFDETDEFEIVAVRRLADDVMGDLAEAEVDRIMAMADADGSGEIDYSGKI